MGFHKKGLKEQNYLKIVKGWRNKEKDTCFSPKHSVQNVLTDIVWMQVSTTNSHVKIPVLFHPQCGQVHYF